MADVIKLSEHQNQQEDLFVSPRFLYWIDGKSDFKKSVGYIPCWLSYEDFKKDNPDIEPLVMLKEVNANSNEGSSR